MLKADYFSEDGAFCVMDGLPHGLDSYSINERHRRLDSRLGSESREGIVRYESSRWQANHNSAAEPIRIRATCPPSCVS